MGAGQPVGRCSPRGRGGDTGPSRLFPFCDNHPRGTWAVRGTCCFDYKGDPEHGYCTTCPHKCDNERRNELQEWLRNPALAP